MGYILRKHLCVHLIFDLHQSQLILELGFDAFCSRISTQGRRHLDVLIIYIYIHTSIFVYIYIWIHTVYVYIYIHNIYIYVYIYIHNIYVYIYIYILYIYNISGRLNHIKTYHLPSEHLSFLWQIQKAFIIGKS